MWNLIKISVLNIIVTLNVACILLVFIEEAESMHIAIIGAGAAGLNALRHCLDDENYQNITCDIFEQTNQIGGTWYFTNYTDIDQDGLPVHTSMYENLRTNIPKEAMIFPGFPYPEYNESFITQEQVFDYLESYVEKYQLRPHIKFHSKVTKVSPIENNRWEVSVKDLLANEEKTSVYDGVMVCNGHFSKPNIPNLPGKELFEGSIIHSRYFRNPSHYKNQTVLILGAGASGRDIALIVAEVAKKVYVSHSKAHLNLPNLIFPKNVEQVLPVSQILKNKVILTDDKVLEVDSIIWCTGYLYDFPFLSEKCKIEVDNGWVKPLYKQMINIKYPTMAIVGLPWSVLPFPVFDFQNRFFLNYMNGTTSLPSKEEMFKDFENDINVRLDKWKRKKFAHFLGIQFETQYFEDLARLGHLTPLPKVYIKIHNFVYGKMNIRHLKFKIIDDENYEMIDK